MGLKEEFRKADRACWECRKRRYACDRSQPSCKKCQQTSKDCPGYNDQKPLQWLEPGRVSLRPICKNRPTKVYSRNISHVPSGKKALNMEVCINVLNIATDQDDAAQTKDVDHANSNRITRPNGTADQDALHHCRRTRALRAPPYGHLSNDKLELLDAWRYCRFMMLYALRWQYMLTKIDNERIVPNAKDAELLPNPSVVAIPLELLNSIAPTIHHALTCAALNHFVLSAQNEIDQVFITDVRAKVFQHRGAAIKALSDEISNAIPSNRHSTISSIFSFMTMEVRLNAAWLST